jgi:hypothetical protein
MRKYLPLVAAFAMILCWVSRLYAQIAIHADVDKTIAALNDQITMTVSVTGSGGSLPDPQMPILSNFGVYSSGKSQSISIMNGHMETDTQYTYVLVPRFVGKGTIPPITVTYQGRRYQTRPIVIKVLKQGASLGNAGGAHVSVQAPPGANVQSASGYNYNSGADIARSREPKRSDVFVTAKLDKKKSYVNQQTTLSIKFFTAVSLAGSPQYTPPKLAGFLVEDLPPQRNGKTVINGRMYYYSEIKMALFPVQSGRLPVGSAAVNCQLQKNIAVDPFPQSFLNNFFSGQLGASEPRSLRSDPLILPVMPLPSQGRPAHFSGAVGKFTITAALDRDRANIGDAVNLSITISGEGNLKGLESPLIPSMPDFHAYDTVSSLNLNKQNDIVQGWKVFKTVLVPRISGALIIPPISFSYFDPQARVYRTVSTHALTLHATRGPNSSSTNSSLFNPSAALPQEVSTISEDIRYLKPYQRLSLPERLLSQLALAGPINAVPFLIFVIVFGFDRHKDMKARNPKEMRKRQAFKKAVLIIRQTQKGNSSDVRKIAERLSEALTGYLADKVGQAPSALTLKSVEQDIQKINSGISQPTIENIRRIWSELDSKRFAPSSLPSQMEASEMAQDALALIESIERELNP